MPPSAGTLFIVATPIGNLGDMTKRAVETLSASHVVCCEDTRVTAKLLAALDIRVRTMSLHEHTDDSVLRNVVDMLLAGKTVSYVSDAGTPGIADPGGKLVAMAVAADIRVVPIPGANAAATALSIAGFPGDRYVFFGFPPHKKGRGKFFSAVDACEETAVLYESTHRILKTIGELPRGRHMVVCRELTKLHETIYRGTVDDVLAALAATSTKGEFVVVLGPKGWH